MAKELFEGFDHTRYEDEVAERWGKQAYERGDRWWRSLTAEDKQQFQQRQIDIANDFAAARKHGLAADSDKAQTLARRQYDWITIGWQGKEPTAEAFTGLAEMYVADPRFTKTYDDHGEGTTAFIRDAMKVYAERNLS